jgi:Fe-S cluster assembly protein SufD
MSAVARSTVPGSLSNAAFEQRLRDAIMDAAPLLNARLLPISVRSTALNKALAAGLPQLRDDLWRYADLRFLGNAPLAPSPLPADPLPLWATARSLLPVPLPGYTRLVFVNGRHAASLSDSCAALNLQAPPLVPERTRHERFGWLNDAFATDLARLSIAGVERLDLVFLAMPGAAPEATYPRVEIQLAANANLTLLERYIGSPGADSLVNVATQIHAGRDAHCRHLRWQGLSPDAQFLDTLQIALDSGAQYSLSLLQRGARSARCSLRASLYGADAQFTLQAVSTADARRTLDTSVLVDHLARATHSTQTLRALARDRAHLALRSRVEVAQTALGAVVNQSLKGLQSDPGSEIDLRPQLEIHTDQVRANHGATTGVLDENQRFYLLSRGLDAHTARSLLEWAFLEDAVRSIEPPELRQLAEQDLVAALDNPIVREATQ